MSEPDEASSSWLNSLLDEAEQRTHAEEPSDKGTQADERTLPDERTPSDERTPDGETPPAPASAGPAPDGSLLSSLPVLMNLLGPMLSGGSAGKGGPGATGPGKKLPDRHTALLKALKPYLSPQRRSAVETLLSVAGMWDALSGMGGLLTQGSQPPAPVSSAAPPPEGGDR